MEEMHPLTQAIIAGDKSAAVEQTQACLDEGEEAGAIIEERLVPGMAVIGDRFQRDEIFVPEMLIAANAITLVAAGLILDRKWRAWRAERNERQRLRGGRPSP